MASDCRGRERAARNDTSHATGLGKSAAAFTLVELLAVIAIVGILAAILVPAAGGVRESARKTKVRVQFCQWIAAIESFRAEYGYYPQFIQNKLNGASSSVGGPIAAADTLFQEVLSGRGSGLPAVFRSSEQNLASGTPAAQNRKRIAFYAFAPDEVDVEGKVCDAFGNVDFTVIVDSDDDGIIPAADLVAASARVRPPNGDAIAPPASVVPAAGIRAGVVIFSAGAGWSGSMVRPENIIVSWR